MWQKARVATLSTYELTERFPRHQLFSLTSQMQRAALSLGANIAEGYGRWAPRDKARFYNMSKSSGDELLHYLIISQDLGYHAGDPALMKTVEEVFAMLRRLIHKTLTDFSPGQM